jgi:hypothetical protein
LIKKKQQRVRFRISSLIGISVFPDAWVAKINKLLPPFTGRYYEQIP